VVEHAPGLLPRACAAEGIPNFVCEAS
jgi:hypothetical protein